MNRKKQIKNELPNVDEFELDRLEVDTIITDESSENSKTLKHKKKTSLTREIDKYLDDVKYAVKASRRENVSVLELNLVHSESDWLKGYYQSLYQSYKKAMVELPRYLERDDISNKLKKRIREVLA